MIARIVAIALILACVGCQRNVTGDTWNILSPRETGDWMPDEAEVLAGRDAVKQRLQAYVEDPTKEAGNRAITRKTLARWDKYRLQAYGKTESDGRKIIQLFFLIPQNDPRSYDKDESWKRDMLLNVDDGGDDFWNAEYDPKTREVLHCWTNTYASEEEEKRAAGQ